MAVSSYAKTNTMGAIGLADGTGTPVTLSLPYDRGDFSLSGLSHVLNEPVAIERRGKFVSLAHGARRYPQVSFSCIVTSLTQSTGTGTAADFLLQREAYSANVSTLGTGHPYTVDVTLTIEGTDFGDSADEVITCTDVYITDCSFAEGEPNTLTFTGTVYGTVKLGGTDTIAEIA